MPTTPLLSLGSPSKSATNGAAHAAVNPVLTASWNPSDTFWHRHIGPDDLDIAAMLGTLGYPVAGCADQTTPCPRPIRMKRLSH